MVVSGHRKSIAFFITLGACLVALAVTLNIGWVLLNWGKVLLLILGILFFALIICGVVLNTIFLVREIRRNEQHDAFINAVTHELKTPIASIRLYLEILQTRETDSAKREEFYGIMLADSDRLLHTVEQVLRTGRTSPAHHSRNRSPIDVRRMVRECVELARTRHHLPLDALECSAPAAAEAELTVLGYQEDLKAAVSNLLDNAIKYSGSQVRVVVEVAQAGVKQIAIRVKDQGVGIPSTELKRIFRRFYRIPDAVAMRVKGTGLGLFIVRSVAKNHGGSVYAESEGAGHGSTFTLRLPAAPLT